MKNEPPLRAALMATFIYETLCKWDPYDFKWPNRFRRALLTRSNGQITRDELEELEVEYRRRFGAGPPPAVVKGRQPTNAKEWMRVAELHAEQIRRALASGEPIIRHRSEAPSMFLRPQTVRQA
ncbi:MAG: hypothetical protein OEM62_04950 [Acidobacteriota bacterium]|nr:hypothetical protein [Acidobacteriota bacterium]